MGLFHIVPRREWEAREPDTLYEPVSFRKDGFIHLSSDRQLLATAARHFAHENDLLVLSIREGDVAHEVRYEEAHGELYPHLHAPLNPRTVVEVVALPRLTDGSFDVPAEWKPWEHYFR